MKNKMTHTINLNLNELVGSDTKVAVVTMDSSKIDTILKSTGSKIAYCKFQKRDGSIRKMSYKCISKKYIKGKQGSGPVYNARKKGITHVYDVHNHGIRAIRWDSVIEIGVNRQKYTFAGETNV